MNQWLTGDYSRRSRPLDRSTSARLPPLTERACRGASARTDRDDAPACLELPAARCGDLREIACVLLREVDRLEAVEGRDRA